MSDIRYVYVRSVDRPVTIAYKFDDDNNQIVYNFAECSDKDQFNKSVGRAVSSGRLLSGSKTHPNKALSYSYTGVKYNQIAAALHAEFDTLLVPF